MAAEVSKPDFSFQWASGGSIVAPSNVKIQTGWTTEVPPFQWENWSQNRQDNAILHLFQKGISEWDATSDYYFTTNGVRSYVQGSDGLIYVAVQDNSNQDPVADSTDTYWKKAFSSPEDTLLRSGVIGEARNIRMSVTAASASSSVTADEVIVKSVLGGNSYLLPSFNRTMNLATTGAGGMDVGLAPISGYVALYAIFNPTTGVSALLATNAASAVTEVYGGANMPSGFTASTLVNVWPTNASRQFVVGYQLNRVVSFARTVALTTSTQQASPTGLNLSTIVPPNAKSVRGDMLVASSAAGPTACIGTISSSTTNIGNSGMSNNNSGANSGVQGPFPHTALITSQTLFYTATVGSGTMNLIISVCEYTF